jgi:hypothetical protein
LASTFRYAGPAVSVAASTSTKCFIFSVDERNREGEEAADALLVASYFCVRFEPAYRIEARGDVVPRPQRSVLTSGQ